MEDVEDVVRRTLEVIQESELVDTTVTDEVDRITFALSRSSVEIGEILNAAHSIALSDEFVSLIRDLHICLTHMVLEWESRHLRISGRMLGRPRISINIPMVKYHYDVHFSTLLIHARIKPTSFAIVFVGLIRAIH